MHKKPKDSRGKYQKCCKKLQKQQKLFLFDWTEARDFKKLSEKAHKCWKKDEDEVIEKEKWKIEREK